jgi:hypothetical protein
MLLFGERDREGGRKLAPAFWAVSAVTINLSIACRADPVSKRLLQPINFAALIAHRAAIACHDELPPFLFWRRNTIDLLLTVSRLQNYSSMCHYCYFP